MCYGLTTILLTAPVSFCYATQYTFCFIGECRELHGLTHGCLTADPDPTHVPTGNLAPKGTLGKISWELVLTTTSSVRMTGL